ncbi:MAG: hypothetical protein HYZ51_02560 [Candidatus Doudnabacteria bacterium]|nr:hypothetical protein [Candidatus Doudnabacteria bacterium]
MAAIALNAPVKEKWGVVNRDYIRAAQLEYIQGQKNMERQATWASVLFTHAVALPLSIYFVLPSVFLYNYVVITTAYGASSAAFNTELGQSFAEETVKTVKTAVGTGIAVAKVKAAEGTPKYSLTLKEIVTGKLSKK